MVTTSSTIQGTSLRLAPNEFPNPSIDNPFQLRSAATETAVLAGGCFWCTEAVYRPLEGVLALTPGYAGGTRETADYRSVSSGRTGHAEAIRITYDPARITYGQLLKLFFSIAHDPTQRNRQGNDFGPQYRSAIFPKSEEQHRIAQAYIRQLDEAGAFSGPIVTTIEPGAEFFEAESQHHDYASRNSTHPYIVAVSMPKVRKLEKFFPERLKRTG